MAVAACGQPESDVGAVKAHMPGGGSDRAGDKPAEGRLPAPEGPITPRISPGVDHEGQPAQCRRVRARRQEGDLFDGQLPVGAGQLP